MSIALSILSAVERVFRSTPGARRVTAVRVRVGALSLVDIDALVFALKVASKGTPAEGARFEVTVEEPVFRCRRCGHQWSIPRNRVQEIAEAYGISSTMHLYPDIVVEYLKCPRCGSNDVEIVRGRGVVVETVSLDVEGEHGEG